MRVILSKVEEHMSMACGDILESRECVMKVMPYVTAAS
jgi:hypothetical protein